MSTRAQRSLVPFLILAALAAVLHLRTRPAAGGADRPVVTLEIARELYPDAATLGPTLPGTPIPVLDPSGGILGTLLDTSAAADRNPGYGGPVPGVVGLSPDGVVVGVRLMRNDEGPTFVDVVVEHGLLNAWNGLPAAAAAAKPVDAVSGATATCAAIRAAVQQTLAAQGAEQARPTALRRSWKTWLPWGVFGLALLSFLSGGRVPGMGLLLRLATVVVLGLATGTCLSLTLAQSWLARGVPWRHFPFLAALGVTAVLLPVLTGRSFYCAYACPFGGAQDLASRLGPGWRPRLPRWLISPLHVLRGAGLLTLYALLLAGTALDLAATEPFAAFQWSSAPWPSLALAGGFLGVAILLPRVWCQHLCPTGYLLECCRGIRPRSGDAPALLTFERGALLAALTAALVLVCRPPARPRQPEVDLAEARVRAGIDLEPRHPQPVPDVLTVIRERRTVRKYTDAPVLPDHLDTLVRAGLAAPAGGSAPTACFVVVTERKRLRGLAAALPTGKMLASAGAALIIGGDSGKAPADAGAHLWVQECSAAAENVLLAAQGLGLGAAWVGVYPDELQMAAIRAVCNLPEDTHPLCVIALGQPAETPSPRDTYDPRRVHWEKW